MKDLKFDTHAMVSPKTVEDFIAIMNEAIAEIQRLNEILDEILNHPSSSDPSSSSAP